MKHWLRSYALLLRWNAVKLRVMLPLFAVVQAGLGVAVIIGFGYLMPSVDQSTMLYLATGGTTIGLISIGMVMAPQLVAQSRVDGSAGFDRTLPVPGTAMLAADLTGWLLSALPGIVLSLVIAALRYDIDFNVSPLVVPAFALVSLTSTAVGYALAYGLPPMGVNIATQVLVFFTLLFSPVNFPVDRLPGWLQAAHAVLPVRYMADAVRQTLDAPASGVAGRPFAMLTVWACLCAALAHRAMTRRA